MALTTSTDSYLADLRDHRFLLFEQFGLPELLRHERFHHIDEATANVLIDEGYAFARQTIAPLNAVGDAEGCRLEGGMVKAPAGFRAAWHSYYALGWELLTVDQAFGGQGAPVLLSMPMEEFTAGANLAFSIYAGLTRGASDVIENFGSAAQKAKYLPGMFNGRWTGTMCLTEAHAGSDLGTLKTRAVPQPDGTYLISGTKTFISGGDHDLTENIIHLVLARVDGGPPGTKGLSLFIVPKHRVGEDGSLAGFNNVVAIGVEHKMGIAGSATCTLSYGDGGPCVGELIGDNDSLHQGMRQIFLLMNRARRVVAMQGLAVASAAYLKALRYARERVQGSSIKEFKNPKAPRVAIIEHPDVRRMLLDMKARVEGLRTLHAKILRHADWASIHRKTDETQWRYHSGQIEILTPVFKSYATDQGFRVCEAAIQTLGGAGFIKDHGVEQHCRDIKVCSLYEGTNHIQAMDLVGRKLGLNGGLHFQHLVQDMATFVQAHRAHARLGGAVAVLDEAVAALRRATGVLLEWAGSDRLDRVALNANRYLEIMAECVLSWLLLEQAVIALDKLPHLGADAADHGFYTGKWRAATYFVHNVLAATPAKVALLVHEDQSALDIPNDAFAQV